VVELPGKDPIGSEVAMSGVHLHLLLNHIPVLGTIGALLLLIFALWSKSADIRRAAMGGFVLIALLTIPVYMTGDAAKDAVRGLPGVTRPLVQEHEDAALFAMISASLTGVIALFAMFMEKRRPQMARPLTIAVLIVALWSTSVLVRVSYLGGLVRHTEIRPAATASAP
jgi:hypothetical protein